MQVKKLNASTIRKTESKIRTGGQKVITAEQKLKKDLTASTIGDEEEEERTDRRKEPDKRRDNPIRKIPNNVHDSTTQADIRRTYRNTCRANADKVGVESAQYRKELAKKERYRVSRKRKAPVEAYEGQKNSPPQTRQTSWSPQKTTYQQKTGSKEKAACQNKTQTAKSFGKETARAGKSAAAGAATAGVSVGVTAVEKMVNVRANRIKRAKMKLLASMEAEHQEKKESARQQERRRNTSLQEEETKQEAKSFSGAVKLLIPVMFPMILIMVVFAAVFGSMTSEQEADNSGSVIKIIDVAKKEEAMSNVNIGGYKYKNWYGLDDNWCAMFVSWCANQCGYIDSGIMPKTASVSAMQKWYNGKKLYQTTASGYQPKPGDIIIFGNGKSHTGIVIEYDSEKKQVVTIEGNTGKSDTNPYHKGSCVKKKTYALTNAYIVGYGTPAYPTDTKTE